MRTDRRPALESLEPDHDNRRRGPVRRRHRLNVRRTGIVLKPNNSRVVIRPFEPTSEQRIERIIARVMSLSEPEVDVLLEDVMREFHNRHQKTRHFFLHRFEQVKQYLLTDQPLSENRRMLIGAYFTQEYALESAALFNPSMVWHPDQSGLEPGSRRFVLSLRATGEGHISSITFRSGTIDAESRIRMDEPTRFVTAPEQVPNTLYDKNLFFRKLLELGVDGPFVGKVLGTLNDQFTLEELQRAIRRAVHQSRPRHHENEPVVQGMLTLAKANYEISFSPEQHISERVIFPSSPTEANGIEDARFVQFHDDDGSVRYYATYTAFDGKVILPQILETDDFLHFKISTLNGPEVRNKGFALFPRKVNGLYAMLSRQDNENIYLMYSDMLHFWYTKELIAKPTYAWEFVQLGNCGSPHRDRGRLAGPDPRRRPDAQVRHGGVPARPRRPLARDRPPRNAAPGARRQRARGLRPQRRLQLRRRHPQPRADHPLRHVRLRQHLRHRLARRGPGRDGAGLIRPLPHNPPHSRGGWDGCVGISGAGADAPGDVPERPPVAASGADESSARDRIVVAAPVAASAVNRAK